MPTYKIISARSPYQVVINEATQISTKVELFLWNKGTTQPTIPTYIMSEAIASVTQIETNYNIAPFILEYIDKYKTLYDDADVIEADNNEWCIFQYKTYYSTDGINYTLLDTVDGVGLNAFTRVEDGYNYDILDSNAYCLLADNNIKVNWNTIIPFYNLVVVSGNYDFNYYDDTNTNINTFSYSASNLSLLSVPLVFVDTTTSVRLEIVSGDLLYTINTEEIQECKYEPRQFWFVNKLGGWQPYVFFKASTDTINVKGSEYNLMQREIDYDYRRGQSKPFNINGSKTMKVNTGWVEESDFDILQEMMLSDTILYNENPMTVKSTSLLKQTYLKERNINYTIEFEYANNLINTVV